MSTCGLRAVVTPSARYSTEATCPKRSIREGSKVAARPREEGQREIVPPLPA